MFTAVPSFPPFEQWQRMSESEQDAFIARIEHAKARKALTYRICVGLLGTATLAGIATAVYGLLALGPS
jgi:hypothetical protein